MTHVFDTSTLAWSSPVTYGEPPLPRAGMTLCSVRERLFLFGGSGRRRLVLRRSPGVRAVDDVCG